jgi:cbb3-type cytochrome oxidase subunit 3
MEHKQAQITWGIIGIGVVGFLIFFIGCLYCIHRHNVRKMRTKSKLNNSNVKVIPAKQLEANEITDNSITNSDSTNPEKLLIGKRSEV